MITSILYLLFAILGLSFLIFIHELGHYFMAKRVGMDVEVFSIGFGKPFYTFKRGKEKWQICYLIFGGYVKIRGMEGEKTKSKRGFYAKRPVDQIKVLAMGPLVNLLFAFLAFSSLWLLGGREKPFSSSTHLIGWVDPASEMYQKGMRSGDKIDTFDHRPFGGFQDFLYYSVLSRKKPLSLVGEKINYNNQSSSSYHYTLNPYLSIRRSHGKRGGVPTMTALAPAEFLIYKPFPNGRPNPLMKGAPINSSGIQYGDRIVWVDGERVFSNAQLNYLINDSKTLLTIQRGDQRFLMRVPRLLVDDLRLTREQKGDIEDWQHAMGLKKTLYFIPYQLSPSAHVESFISYVDDRARERVAPKGNILQKGDRIIAVDGSPVSSSRQFFQKVQKKNVLIMVQRGYANTLLKEGSEDQEFLSSLNWGDLTRIVESVGLKDPIQNLGDLHLLCPVTPVPLKDLPLSSKNRQRLIGTYMQHQKAIEKIEDKEEQSFALKLFKKYQNKKVLGIVLQDALAVYNPTPLTLFKSVTQETGKTLSSLVTGSLAPKWLAGPIGMTHMMQKSLNGGGKEALFWLGMISLNLGLLNLLPIPVLDGGRICFALWSLISRKAVSPKTIEKLTLPFALLLILLFLYITYQDILRLTGRFFK